MGKIDETKEVARAREVANELRSRLGTFVGPIQIESYKFDTRDNEVLICFDTPRDYRHPEECPGVESTPEYQRWMEMEDYILSVVKEVVGKYPELKYTICGDASGGDIKSI